eukprot:CAMPEP_0117501808 /NCGR_PEP_ID=MMETSP0784-20121206/23490_1 /TAXON_ID=39447 /ORGANISM="" /LENGTH=44 /DNA_ID= /DNA_START= /DNA_END= /DNA_ORIENTATION=
MSRGAASDVILEIGALSWDELTLSGCKAEPLSTGVLNRRTLEVN